MVIHGQDQEHIDPATAKLEGDRIRLPARYAKQAKLTESGTVDCWLLVLKAGGYRLLKKSDSSPQLREILSASQEIESPGDLLEGTSDSTRAALPARLVSCVASPNEKSWRLTIPGAARYLAPGDQSRVFFKVVAGYVEIWFTDALRQEVSVPISELLP